MVMECVICKKKLKIIEFMMFGSFFCEDCFWGFLKEYYLPKKPRKRVKKRKI